MRHRTRGRILGRTHSHRTAMFRNMAASLFAHERIITTQAKAKELRPFAERLITIAKKGAVSAESGGNDTPEQKHARDHANFMRRRLIALLGGKKKVIVGNEEVNVVDKLMKEIGPRFKDRPGGYTRIVKRAERRQGDASYTAFIELLRAGDSAAPAESAAAKDSN